MRIRLVLTQLELWVQLSIGFKDLMSSQNSKKQEEAYPLIQPLLVK